MDMLFSTSGSTMWVCETTGETVPLMLCWNLPEMVKINYLISTRCQKKTTHSDYRISNCPDDTEVMEPSDLSLTHSCHHANPTNR